MTSDAAEKKRIVLRRYIAAQEDQTPVQHHLHGNSEPISSTHAGAAAAAPAPALKRKRGGGERLNDAQRLEIIRQRRQPDAPSLRKLAGAFNVSERSIRNVMLSAAVIEQRAAHADVKAQLRTYRSAAPRFPELEERVFQWLQALRAARANPTPSATIEKAKAVAAELGIPATAFKASPGWFERFRKRRRLVDARLSVGGDDSGSNERTPPDLVITTSSSSSSSSSIDGADTRAAGASGDQVQEDGDTAESDTAAAPSPQSGTPEPASAVAVSPAPPQLPPLSTDEDPPSVRALLRQLAHFEGRLRAFQDAHPSELGRLQQCLANASVIRHDLLAVHANMQVRSLRASAGLDAVGGAQLQAPSDLPP